MDSRMTICGDFAENDANINTEYKLMVSNFRKFHRHSLWFEWRVIQNSKKFRHSWRNSASFLRIQQGASQSDFSFIFKQNTNNR